VETDPELILEDARSLRDGMWRIDQLARDVAERLDERIEAETLDSRAEAEYVREALERM
jgi:hypothetical protein